MKLNINSDGEIYLVVGVLIAKFVAIQNYYLCYPYGYINIRIGFEENPLDKDDIAF
jgi:hypothetical protein